VAGLNELMREYERARFPAARRLDLHGEAPRVARDRALQWIQSRAHESPGEELLLIVERGGRPGKPPSPLEGEVRELLESLRGRLIEWWQPFAPGSLAVRIALEPRMTPWPEPRPSLDAGDGRTAETAGAARPPPDRDIPSELLDLARAVTELRLQREGLSSRIADVVLREVWIEAQALAMEARVGFDIALERIRGAELERAADADR
jgi:hypothetical protein